MSWKVLFIIITALYGALSTSFAWAGNKVALVVGNAAYQHAGRLNNPPNDAKVVAEMFRARGFTLVGNGALVNLNRQEFEDAVQNFGRLAKGADVAVVFYSGHGAQIHGTNYLIPIDTELTDVDNADSEMLSANEVMQQFTSSQARLKILFLDACRNDPFKGFQVASKNIVIVKDGLAEMRAPVGTVIGFATQPDDVASDGPSGANSPYTHALSEAMNRPGLELFELLNEVGLAVMSSTNGHQQPWLAASPISGRFYFTKPVAVPSEAPPAGPVVSAGAAIPYIQQAYESLSKKDYNAAHAQLSKAKSVDPQSALPYSYDGYAYFMEGKDLSKKSAQKDFSKETVDAAQAVYTKAFPQLDEAIRLDPNYQPAHRHRGNAILAAYQLRLGAGRKTYDQLERATKDLAEAVKLDPKSKTALNSLGTAYLFGEEYQRAITAFTAAIAIDSKYASPYAGRCTAYAFLGDLAKAKADAKAAATRASSLSDQACLNNIVTQ